MTSNTPYALAAIITRYLCPTNYRGSRIVATRADHRPGDKRITVPWDHALDPFENHLAAAHALAKKLGWHGTWTGGSGRDGEYVWVRHTGNNEAFSIRG